MNQRQQQVMKKETYLYNHKQTIHKKIVDSVNQLIWVTDKVTNEPYENKQLIQWINYKNENRKKNLIKLLKIYNNMN